MRLTENRKTLIKNYLSLSTLQLSNFLIPLITVPYLVRVLGVENFGLVNFAAAFTAYFITFTDYGFNLSAPRNISINRNDNVKLSEIVSAVLSIKIILLFLSMLILALIVETFDLFSIQREVFYLSFGLVIGSVLFPQWYFQGIENMKYITGVSVLLRSVSLIFIFLLVRTEGDYLILISINSVTQIVIGVVCIMLMVLKFKMKLKLQSLHQLLFYFKDAWHIFISSMAINLYTSTNLFLLGVLGNNTAVGYFAAADKLKIAVQSFIATVSNTIYPHLSALLKGSLENGIHFIRKIIKYFGTFTLILSILLFIFSHDLILFVMGEGYSNSVPVMKILSFLPFIIFFSNVAGIQLMLNLDYKKEFSRIIIAAAIINLCLSFLLIPEYNEIGSAIAVLITEIFVTILMLIFIKKKGITLFRFRRLTESNLSK